MSRAAATAGPHLFRPSGELSSIAAARVAPPRTSKEPNALPRCARYRDDGDAPSPALGFNSRFSDNP